ncbi:MAG: hypothetical protein ACPGWR_22870 [Ardenticatenaceae bacterium]
MCIGVIASFSLLSIIIRATNKHDPGASFLSNFIALSFFVIAVISFVAAFTHGSIMNGY